jgi:acyl-CoA thioesterase-2
MGDLGADTEINGADGEYYARLSPDWEIWGPCGGYLVAILLRVAGEHAGFMRPASIACQFLGVGDFSEAEVEAHTLRVGRRGEAVRVRISQHIREVAEALVWMVAEDLEGPAADWTVAPDVPPPAEVPTIQERGDDPSERYRFWTNLEYRPIDWLPHDEWGTRAVEPRWQAWFRYRPTAVFDDPRLEAARVAMLCDIAAWPAIARGLPPDESDRWIAPNLDVAVTFHQLPRGSEYLLLEAEAPVAADGLAGGVARVWSEDGRLLASSTQQLLFRPSSPTG